MTTSPGPKITTALVSMPWAIYNRPSIQLGTLKAYVERETSCRVDTQHPYLYFARTLGLETYTLISDSSWAGEAIFAALLFPEKLGDAERVFVESLGKNVRQLPEFAHIVQSVEDTCSKWLAHIQWSRYSLVGFSLCFNQLFASLYAASRISSLTEKSPPIVFGGSSCSGSLGRSLLDHFPFLDYVVDGEGENPLAALCRYLDGTSRTFPERVLCRNGTHDSPVTGTGKVANLDSLPTPDFSGYFQQLAAAFPDSPFIPTLPLEFSRGCWWGKCTFCNLNLQWCGYRNKNADKVISEVKELTELHQCLDLTFTDNALPPKEADNFFAATAGAQADLRFFAEVRGITRLSRLLAYKKGGLETIQVGIESLSTSLLNKMKKGVSAIENLAIMKHAAAAGINLEGNLIVEFPGSTTQEVAETLDHLDYALPFNPLSAAAFFLGYGSPVERRPRDYGITAITHHRKNRLLFPTQHLRTIRLLTMEYRGDRMQQRKLWRQVRRKISAWHDFHANRSTQTSPPLGYRDGATFLLIRQEIAGSAPLRHKLKGLSREIYLFCDEIKTVTEIKNHFSSLKESAILAFIHQLCQKRLMFRENDKVLSLAIRQQ